MTVCLQLFQQFSQRTGQNGFKGLGQLAGNSGTTVRPQAIAHISQASSNTVTGLVEYQRRRYARTALQALAAGGLFCRQEAFKCKPVGG